ncbi:2-methoxy-6-polyprenyl-1,4-benzoquinol methylase, mitochondrial [Fopius arisanus]|uniref:2-methoxy-6-polyprenyl-1,4-benzoquinol methylase, mitochondrial n=1 Tax=Fopius arisanus TaxID=64838 RepID=A0A9R1TUF2_9HYME|nr:PREDICTED: 2-methoxy-6-polyprenyl-1,4-benzoquinol methylase, mitochondrial [Fopius arisanus]
MELLKCLSKELLRRNHTHGIRQFSASVFKQNQTESQSKNEEERTTHFGFETVKESEKGKKVHTVFEQVANSYDLMNDAMSLGIHRIWKDMFIQELSPTHGSKLLDMAGGTGDITFRYLHYLNTRMNPKGLKSHVTVSDINQNMLDVGKTRAERLGYTVQKGYDIAWLQGDAEKLPIKDESYTAYTIAFGVRNCTRIDKVLEEAYRVLQPGGRFLCLEFSHLTNNSLQWAYDQYSFQMIPVMGMLLAGKWEPYQYLVESIRRFPKQEEFKEMIENAGFRHVTYRNLTFGIVAIHSGFKI